MEPPSDAPILMGPPTTDANDFMMDFAAPAPQPSTDDAPYEPPPAAGEGYDYIGEVNESTFGEAPIVLEPPQGDAPILLGGEEPTLVEDVAEEEDEPPFEPTGPSPMAKWNTEWQVTLRERKDAENAEKATVIEASRADIARLDGERAAKLDSRKGRNRESESAKLREMEEDLEQDNSWERVVKLIDLTQDSVERSAEVKRMRDVIIGLKNDKERANLLS